jgi:CspA family cold shock protein
MSNKNTATVKWFDNAKGYGFLEGPNGDVFVHYRAIVGDEGGYKTLTEGQTVEYTQVKGEKGWQAEDVVPVG